MTIYTSRTMKLDATGHTVMAQMEHLRHAGPAPMVLLPDGIAAHAVVRGDVARALMTDNRVTRDPRRSWTYYQDRSGRLPGWMMAWASPSMLNSGGNEHARLRKLVQSAFTRRSIDALAPAVENIVDGLIAKLARRDGRVSVDLRRNFSYRIPSAVICDLFGVPDEQRPTMLAHIDSVIDTAQSQRQAEANFRGLYAATHALVQAKRHQAGEDLTTSLLQVHEADGDHLSEHELISTLMLMIGAGTETTVALIDHSVRNLLQRPELVAQVRRENLWDEVIEETLRRDPPIRFLPLRYATDRIELSEGAVIEEGAAILIGFGGDGRDPEVHEAPEKWDLDREDRQHLAFGHGMHFCLGAPLARLEARIALTKLFAAFPRMRPAVDLDSLPPLPSFIAHDTVRLPVRLSA